MQNTWITTHLSTPKGWKAELVVLANPCKTVYKQIGHLSTIDRAQGGESLPTKDWHPKHCVFSIDCGIEVALLSRNYHRLQPAAVVH